MKTRNELEQQLAQINKDLQAIQQAWSMNLTPQREQRLEEAEDRLWSEHDRITQEIKKLSPK